MNATALNRYFPLERLKLSLPSTPYKFTDGLWIVPNRSVPAVDQKLLSPMHNAEVSRVPWWLHVEPVARMNARGSEEAHLFLFALWLLRPHPGTLRFKFFLNDGVLSDGARLITSATFNAVDVDRSSFGANDLLEAKQLFDAAIDIDPEDRLGLCISLAISSTWAERWHIATMLATAAIESLLTYSEKQGSTRRLSKACAALLDPTGPERHMEFDAVYKIRSKIMHGRSTAGDPEERLRCQARCQRLLRQLLRRVLLDPVALAALNDTDDARETYLVALDELRLRTPAAASP